MENSINPHNELAMPKRNLPRDVFLHLFAIVTLYWSAISFITLCWQYVNYFFPDVLNYSYGYTDAMQFALASLFIVFPLFILVSWFLNKIYVRESEVRDSKIRKWLIYLTLFITALVVIGDLVFVINTFLKGELTTRFILKAFSIIGVAGVVFGYYLDDVKRSAPSKLAKIFAIGTSLVVLVFVISTFFVIGSPMSARKAQFDQQRVGDLQSIQYQVVNYWQQKGQLPQTLADLHDSLSGYVAPMDPESNTPYEYLVKSATNLSFQLCATFNLNGNMNNSKTAPLPMSVYPGDYLSANWGHAAGRVCFERTIDQQKYPPFNKK